MRPPVLELRVSVRNVWERIDEMRRAVIDIITATGAGMDVAEALSMTTAELLENAMKYGHHGDGPSIDLEIRRDGAAYVVAVTNALGAGAEPHLARLRERVADLRTAADPAATYAALLARVYEADESVDATSTGLGLARIA